MSAYMIGHIVRDSRIPGTLGDTQITHANDKAAELHGYADARAFVGTYLSDIQLEPCNQIARRQWYCRKRSMPVKQTYPAVVVAPDGERIGHKRTLRWMLGVDGRETYMVSMIRVRELSHRVVTSAEGPEIDGQDFARVCGQFTIADIRRMYNANTLSLHCGNNLTTIIEECMDIAKRFFASDDGVALAFNRSLTNWSSVASSSPTIQLAVTCPKCGWHWWRRALHGTTQRCPACRGRVDLAEALGAQHQQSTVARVADLTRNTSVEGTR